MFMVSNVYSIMNGKLNMSICYELFGEIGRI